MKALKEVVNLEGQSEEINVMDLRKHPGEILTQVSLGKSFLIKKSGKPLAVLSKFKPKGV